MRVSPTLHPPERPTPLAISLIRHASQHSLPRQRGERKWYMPRRAAAVLVTRARKSLACTPTDETNSRAANDLLLVIRGLLLLLLYGYRYTVVGPCFGCRDCSWWSCLFLVLACFLLVLLWLFEHNQVPGRSGSQVPHGYLVYETRSAL